MTESDADTRVWMVRSTDGREAPEPVSLNKIRRGIHLGKLTMDMEVARVGTHRWEPILALIARYEPIPRPDESAPFSALSANVEPPPPRTHEPPRAPSPAAPAPQPTHAPVVAVSPAPAVQGPKAPEVAKDMSTIDRIEKGARAALWTTLALMFIGMPVSYWRHQRAENALRDELATAQAQHEADVAREKAPRSPLVLPYATFGSALSFLSMSKAEGHTWFTNASPRAGFVCLEGVAKNPATQKSTTSIPSCAPIAPFASDIHVTFMFAGRDLEDLCPKASCEFSVKDAPVVKE